MKGKQTICILLAAVLLAMTGGCGAQGGADVDIPSYEQYEDSRQLEFLAFWSPPINEQQYTWMKECGITAVLVDNKYESYSGANRKRILNMCAELGIDVYFPLGRDQGGDAVEQYRQWFDYPAFRGFFCDEPIMKSHVDNIAAQFEAMNAIDPERMFIGNLLSGYSEDPEHYAWIFSDRADFEAARDSGEFFADYDAYVSYYRDTVIKGRSNIRVSATNYPLLAYDKGYERTLASTWLRTLGTCEQTAQKAGVDMWQFISTTASHNGGDTNYKRQPTEEGIRWQSYAALAFGARGIEEFVYTTVGGPGAEFTAEDHGPIWWAEQSNYESYYRTEVWYMVQSVHQELKKFDHVLLSFDWQGVLCNAATDDPNTTECLQHAVGVLENHERIAKLNSTRDLLVGCFRDEVGNDGFLVVNFDETAYHNQTKNEVSIRFQNATRALVYVKGEEQAVPLRGGVYTCTLLPGEAVFVIPVA